MEIVKQSRVTDTIDRREHELTRVRTLEKYIQIEFSFNLTFHFSNFFFDFSHILQGHFFTISGKLKKMKILKFDRVPKKYKVPFLFDIMIDYITTIHFPSF